MDINLKPCPFCGGQAKIFGYSHMWYVKCPACGASTACENTDKKAADAWNRRADDER